MIELLSRMDPGTSGFIALNRDDQRMSPRDRLGRVIADPASTDEQREDAERKIRAIEAAEKHRCPTCRGKKLVRVPEGAPGLEPRYVECPRCKGTGKPLETHATATRSALPPSHLPPERIAFALFGMPDHWYRAAAVMVTHDERLLRLLERDIAEQLLAGHAADWRMSPEMTAVRTLGLSRVIARSLALPPSMGRAGGMIDVVPAADLMCCTTRAWREVWRARAEPFAVLTRGWAVDADRYMHRRVYGEEGERSAWGVVSGPT